MGWMRRAASWLASSARPLSLDNPSGWLGFGGGRMSAAGAMVTEESMLSLATAWSCVRLISETISTLPLNIYERTSSGGKRIATNHPLQFIIHDQPNPDTTATVHWEATVAAMLMRGNGRAEKLMLGDRLVGLRFLIPNRLAVTRQSDGTLRYRYTDLNGQHREIPPSRIFNIPGFSLDGVLGTSVIHHSANVVGNALAADNVASGVFKSGLRPTRFLKTDKWITNDQRDQYRESLNRIKNSLDNGEVPVLEGGMDFGTIGMNPDDAQLLQSRTFSVEELCRWFRVPPWMVGHTGSASNWGTGIEQQMIGFLTFTLRPWLTRIEQAISKDLMTPGDRARYYPKFSVEGLLRADSAARAAFYTAMVNNGILTRDECRQLEDREAMGGNAAVLTVQSAMTTLNALGTNTDLQTLRSSLRSVLGLDDDQKGE
jgi:HK97 family phage portal protein